MDGKKIIVAYDGSPDSEKALKLATTLAKAMYANLVLVSVVDLTPLLSDDTGNIGATLDAMRREHENVLETGKMHAEDLGVAVTTAVLEGNTPEVLIKHAHEVRAMMIVVGTRGLGGFKRLLLGSTAQALVTYSDIPVVVAK